MSLTTRNGKNNTINRGAPLNGILAPSRLAPSFLNATIYREDVTGTIVAEVAEEEFTVGNLPLKKDQEYYLVASSKFAGYYFLVALVDGQWKCSDISTPIDFITKVRVFLIRG